MEAVELRARNEVGRPMRDLGICCRSLSPGLGGSLGLGRAGLLAVVTGFGGRVGGVLCKRNLIAATRLRRGRECDNTASARRGGGWERGGIVSGAVLPVGSQSSSPGSSLLCLSSRARGFPSCEA